MKSSDNLFPKNLRERFLEIISEFQSTLFHLLLVQVSSFRLPLFRAVFPAISGLQSLLSGASTTRTWQVSPWRTELTGAGHSVSLAVGLVSLRTGLDPGHLSPTQQQVNCKSQLVSEDKLTAHFHRAGGRNVPRTDLGIWRHGMV